MKKLNLSPSLKEILRESASYLFQKSYVSEGFKGCVDIISPRPVEVEPVFKPYRLIDFGKQSSGKPNPLSVPVSQEQSLTYLSVWLARNDEYESREAFKELVSKIGVLGKKFSVTIHGNKKTISLTIGVSRQDVIPARNAIKSVFPHIEIGTPQREKFATYPLAKQSCLVFREFYTPPPYWRTLATTEVDSVSPILSCLSNEINDNEIGFYELIIQPCRNDWANNIFNLCLAEREGGVPLHVSQEWRQAGFTQEYSEKALQKNNKQMFAVIIRVGALCDPRKGEAIIKSLSLSLGSFLWGGQKMSYLTEKEFAEKIGQQKTGEMIQESNAYRAGSLFSIDEVAFLSPIPTKEDIHSKKCPIESSSGIIPPQQCPTDRDGAFIGNVTVAGKKFPYYQKEEYRTRGTVARGVMGSGKSVQIIQMSGHDLKNRRRFLKNGSGKRISIILMDQCKDTYAAFLRKITKQDIKSTDIFDPTIPGYVPAYNLVKLNPWENIDKKADNRANQIKNFFSTTEWSAHIEHIFRNAFYLLLADPQAVLTDMWKILDDKPLAKQKRSEILKTINNEEVHLFWEREFYETDKAKIGLIRKKISSFLTDKRIQDIFSVQENKFDMTKIINEGRILPCNLPEGELGTGPSRFLAGCLTEDIIDATKSRVKLTPEEREKIPAHFYIDEIAKCPPKSFEDFTVSMRRYNVSIILSYHFDEQLTEELQAGIRNLGTTILFRQDYRQAKNQAFQQFLGRIDANEFIDLEQGEGYIITPDSCIAKFRSTMPQEGENREIISKVIERNIKENYVSVASIQKRTEESELKEPVSRMGEEI